MRCQGGRDAPRTGQKRIAGAPCGGALRVRAKTNKKAPPPPKRGEAKLAVPPLFCTGIPLMQISLRLNAARRLRLVSAHRTGGPGAPHRGAWRTAQRAWRTVQGGLAHRTEGLAHRTEGLAHRTGAWRTAQGAWRTAQGAWRTAQGGLAHRTEGLARGAGSAERLGRELRRAAAQGVLSAGDTRSLVHSGAGLLSPSWPLGNICKRFKKL